MVLRGFSAWIDSGSVVTYNAMSAEMSARVMIGATGMFLEVSMILDLGDGLNWIIEGEMLTFQVNLDGILDGLVLFDI